MSFGQIRSQQKISNRPAPVFLLVDLALRWFLLVSAMLLAIQIRLQVSMGQPLTADYQPRPPLMFLLLALAVLLGAAAEHSALADYRVIGAFVAPAHPFRRFLALVILAAISIALLLPDVSQLQLLYFVTAGLLFDVFCVGLPRRLYPALSSRDVFDETRAIWQRRSLLLLWLSFNIQTRYSQRVLGLLWIILLPVATSVVLAFAFSQFMHVQVNAPFIVFYMSALVPYNFFANILFGSTEAVVKRSSILTQVYFPREILVLLLVGETLFDFVFAFAAMLVVNLISGVAPNIQFIYLPIIFLILLLIAFGLALLVSALTVIVRDIPQLLSVALQLLFFMTPVIYPIDQFPDRFRFLFVLNPIAPLIQGARDIITFGRPPDLVALAFPVAFAAVVLTLGYATFRAFETDMTDLL